MNDRPALPVRPIITSIFAAAFAGVKVATKVPSPIPSKFIRVERVGGSDEWAIDRPMVVLQFYAPSDVECEKMALEARNALAGAQGHIHSGAIVLGWNTIGGPHNFPDLDASRERWQLSGELGIATA